MILHHVSVGVKDVAAAGRFYDAVLKTLGYRRVMDYSPGAVAYGAEHDKPEFWVGLPHDGGKAATGNGTHIAFRAPNVEAVHAFHQMALENGGSDDGKPGPRPNYGPHYYGAFVRDPDGNKIEAVLKPEPRVARVKMPAKAAKKRAAAKPKPARKVAKIKAAKKTRARKR
jgi:catechol 2,3-dioxygenase-like lactoylglutathione lyase family enzyme